MFVKDYKGTLIAKEKSRRIIGEDGSYAYYEMGVSCIKMEDGLWYRTTTGKIIFDHSIQKWVHSKNFKGSQGVVKDGTIGHYSDKMAEVTICDRVKENIKSYDILGRTFEDVEKTNGRWGQSTCISEEVAINLGYLESMADGKFYKRSDCNKNDLTLIATPHIPNSERTSTYSLDDDRDYRIYLEKCYDENKIKADVKLSKIAKDYIPFPFGIEIEVANGTVWKRIREPLGFRTCRDGSLDQGIEYVGIPMEGGKGLTVLRKMCEEATKRTVISNKCSVHVHFGDVRRDKLYVVSLWNLLYKIQEEFRRYFPYSRTNSIRDDGKVYAAMLPSIDLKVENLIELTDERAFKDGVVKEFNKIYSYLNNGHPPGEEYDEQFVKDTREVIIKGKKQKQYCYRIKKFNFTTKLPRHAVQGHKWQRTSRYHFVNLLNLFFSHSRTVEFRIMEASTNFNKLLPYMLMCSCILRYAEEFKITLSKDPITISEILKKYLSAEHYDKVYRYLLLRKARFVHPGTNGFRPDWKDIEDTYRNQDKQVGEII